ncbi:ATP-binding protein [Billgrantia bachuensis]|uniref:histidine kinase n=1 Tax=Billgrantia bachuensis TaxID=2717286 RepID=A0ABX0PPT3_9GAMM|nr:ATP-binding protein [Halomonas bachuensis]NIC04576.1 response regulator [Halomonas bachuensis]
MKGSPALRYRIAAFAAVLLFCSALLTAKIIYDRQQQIEHKMLEDLTWSAYQFDREVSEMRLALSGWQEAGLDTVLLRYEILFSRADLFSRGELKHTLMQQPLGMPLEEAIRVVRQIDPLMSALESGQRALDRDVQQSLARQLLGLQELTSRLLLDINAHVARMRTQERDNLWYLYKVLLVLIVLLVLAGLVLVVSLIEEGKANRKRRDLLEVQAHDLDAAVRQAEHASQAKSEFMAVMSHEIRTPLSGVVGVAELLAFEPLTPRGTQLLGTLNDSLVTLQAVINDVIDYTKYDAGSLDIDSQPFHLEGFVAQLSRHYRLVSEGRGIGFVVSVDDTLPTWLLGDTTRIGQVLMNLLNNAFKFTSAGEVRLTVCEFGGNTLCLSVEDTGCGIPEQSQAQIFKPFTQADSTIARRYGGSGLGLAICERLVKAMQGHIDFESTSGVGSRFRVHLPLSVPAPEEVSSAQSGRVGMASSTVQPRGRILVVEDQPANRELARAMLEHLGQTVHVAADGRAGLEEMSRHAFDLVLMDMQMPTLDGLETTRRWRRQEPAGQRALPIVALTANAMPSARQRCLEAGMDDVLCKPYTRQDLQRILRQWLMPRPSEDAVPGSDASPAHGNTPDETWYAYDGSTADRLLSRDTLAALREVLDAEALRILVQRFTLRLVDDRETLQHCLRQEDRQGLRESAHSLKGAAASLGCRELAQAAAELESAADLEDLRVLEEAVARLIQLGHATRAAFAMLGYLGMEDVPQG